MSESKEWWRLTVRLVKLIGQAVYTNELERESKVGKINSKTSKIIRLGSKSENQKWGRLTIRLANH
jgi:hypothetical protein